MATRTSLYSFQNNIIEIAISIDAIGELHSAITPLTKEERLKFGLLDGDNPWRHLGVPDFVLEKPIPENDMYDSGAQKCSSQSSTSNTDTEDARKRSLSNVSITSEDIQKEMEEFSSTWADNEENEVVFHPEDLFDVLVDVLEPPRILLSSACPVTKKFKPSDSIHVESNDDYDVN